jgi:hypothetical protein
MARWASIVVGLVSLLVGIIVILAAKRTAPNRSWLLAILGWVVGYFAITVIGLGILATISIIPPILHISR